MFRNRKPIGPIRRRVLYNDESEDSNVDDNLDIDEKTKDNVYNMMENWRNNIRTEEAERKMLKNYVQAYVDISDEDMEELLDRHDL